MDRVTSIFEKFFFFFPFCRYVSALSIWNWPFIELSLSICIHLESISVLFFKNEFYLGVILMFSLSFICVYVEIWIYVNVDNKQWNTCFEYFFWNVCFVMDDSLKVIVHWNDSYGSSKLACDPRDRTLCLWPFRY